MCEKCDRVDAEMEPVSRGIAEKFFHMKDTEVPVTLTVNNLLDLRNICSDAAREIAVKFSVMCAMAGMDPTKPTDSEQLEALRSKGADADNLASKLENIFETTVPEMGAAMKSYREQREALVEKYHSEAAVS